MGNLLQVTVNAMNRRKTKGFLLARATVMQYTNELGTTLTRLIKTIYHYRPVNLPYFRMKQKSMYCYSGILPSLYLIHLEETQVSQKSKLHFGIGTVNNELIILMVFHFLKLRKRSSGKPHSQ